MNFFFTNTQKMSEKMKQTKHQEKNNEIETQEFLDEETTAELNLPTDQLQVFDVVSDDQDSSETRGNLRIYIAEPLPARTVWLTSRKIENLNKQSRS